MSKRLLDHDNFTGITTWHDYDHSSKKTIITETQDVQAILKANKEAAKSGRNNNKGDYKHFASVPLTVLMKWKTEFGIDWNNPAHMPKIEKLLQSNEYKYLRTCDRI